MKTTIADSILICGGIFMAILCILQPINIIVLAIFCLFWWGVISIFRAGLYDKLARWRARRKHEQPMDAYIHTRKYGRIGLHKGVAIDLSVQPCKIMNGILVERDGKYLNHVFYETNDLVLSLKELEELDRCTKHVYWTTINCHEKHGLTTVIQRELNRETDQYWKNMTK